MLRVFFSILVALKRSFFVFLCCKRHQRKGLSTVALHTALVQPPFGQLKESKKELTAFLIQINLLTKNDLPFVNHLVPEPVFLVVVSGRCGTAICRHNFQTLI